MLGAVAGDIIGSRFEGSGKKEREFTLFAGSCGFTDDTVLTVAVAEWILNGGALIDHFHTYFDRYPLAGYGMKFIAWAGHERREPYNSWGNGSAMRVSPVAFAFGDLETVLSKAQETAEVTHNHKKGICGAQAVAAAIFLARSGCAKDEIRQYVSSEFGYDLNRTLEQIRPEYQFDVSCEGSVPESIIAFLESTDFESAVRNAVSLGGDADTMACIAGSIAEAFYGGVPEAIQVKCFEVLDDRLAEVVTRFRGHFMNSQ